MSNIIETTKPAPTHEAAFSAQIIRAALRDGALDYTHPHPKENESL